MSTPNIPAARLLITPVGSPCNHAVPEVKLPPNRMRHRAALINNRGGVSALCFTKPRAIDMKRATWTTSDEATTCPRCQHLIAVRMAGVK